MIPLFELPSPFGVETGTVLLHEPPGSSASELRARLLDASYSRPFVVDDGQSRYLYFSVHLMQSQMWLKAPNDLAIRYTQEMMSFLLFHSRPRRIVQIGLGGGSLLKFCYYRLPATDLTAIELDPEVIAWRDTFLLPPDGPRLRILQGDGAEYLEQAEKGIDILLVDAFDRTGFAPSLANREFFEDAFTRLSGKGILVINLAGEKESYAGLIDEVMAVFDEQVLVISIPEDGNHLLFAFREPNFDPRWRWIHNHAKELRARFQMDFPAFASKLERSMKSGLARHIALRDGIRARPRER